MHLFIIRRRLLRTRISDLQIRRMILLFLLMDRVSGENFFKRRDHSDQVVFNRRRGNMVENEKDAETLMVKYGYLNCTSNTNRNDNRARRGTNDEPDLIDINELDSMDGESAEMARQKEKCTKEMTRLAIIRFQKKYNIPETGILDAKTKELMSEMRCGNKDIGDVDLPTNQTDSSDNVGQKTLFEKIFPNYAPSNRRRRRAISEMAREMELEDAKKSARRKRRTKISKLGSILGLEKTLQRRHKRSAMINGTAAVSFNKQTILWRLLEAGLSSRIPASEQFYILKLAFRMWSEVIPISFLEENKNDVTGVDIKVAFGKGSHLNCPQAFDGNGGVIAHSWKNGDVHFDDEENFATDAAGLQLLRVAVHEVGHVLGLDHNTIKNDSIMYPIYQPAKKAEDFELSTTDRKQIQSIYGKCKGKFDTVFDWVRTAPNGEPVFNTYFVRKNRYWMYENHANRTRYGDPLVLSLGWKGLPQAIDSFVHVYYWNGQSLIDKQYFFSGDKYYEYDHSQDSVSIGPVKWPRLISQDFGPSEGQLKGIPTDVDATFFDRRNRAIYFFKGEYVYAFKEDRGGCCEFIKKISEEFPTLAGNKPLTSNIDAVYYSYFRHSMYFIKGEDVWVNTYFRTKYRGRILNGLKYAGKWYDIWSDVCDVN